MHFFNTAGPVNKKDHFCIDPLERFDFDQFLQLIAQKKYFALNAPRQSGKTSCLLALSNYLNKEGVYKCLYLNIESMSNENEDMREAMKCILSELSSRARDYLNDDFPEKISFRVLDERGPNLAFNELLTRWAKNSDKPIVLIIDEIDSLKGNILGSILRQLRSGYDKRPELFPQSIILCGVEDIRYKKILISNQTTITAGTIFNIEAKSLRLDNFTREQVELLFAQYKTENNISIHPKALAKIWLLTGGQPWIVNALAYEICFEMIPRKRDINTIRERDVEEAAENIIQRREIHLRNLTDRLNEDRVKKIISPMLTGSEFFQDLSEDDFQYVYDLGLIMIEDDRITIANEIYKEIIPRSLIYSTQLLIRYNLAAFLEKDGRLNFTKILKAFQTFYNQYYSRWSEKFNYKSAGSPLFLQAYLQRIIDGGGKIIRDYGIGRKRVTLDISWPYASLKQNVLIDLRYRTSAINDVIREGTEELYKDMERKKVKEGNLIIFKMNPDELWEQKLLKSKKDTGMIDVWLI
jgi:hypothetical protein